MKHLAWILISNLFMISSCTPVKIGESETKVTQGNQLNACFGYRGNGSSLFATMGGIARLFDQYGSPNGVFGTSSGSVTAFLTESVMVPGAIYTCTDCTATQIAERRSFVIKAFPLVVNAWMESDGLKEDIQKIKEGKKIHSLMMEVFGMPSPTDRGGAMDPPQLSNEIKSVLNTAALTLIKKHARELKDFIAPEYYQIAGIGGTANPELVLKAIDNVVSFQMGKANNSFNRADLMAPGIVNFDYLFKNIGVLADWYAGYGPEYPREKMSALLNSCAKNSRGVWWNTIAAKPYGGSNCGKEYYGLFAAYFNQRKKNVTDKLRRVDEKIGTYIPAFVSTSAISGNGIVDRMNQAADTGQFDSINKLDLGRENFKVLYFGPQSFKETIMKNRSMFSDVVTQNIVSMDPVTWMTAMKASGREPATARAMALSEAGERYLATGGFVDQIQTKLMTMVGCGQKIAITTNSPIIGFSNRYAPRTWNLDQKLTMDLFDPANSQSAESISFDQTDGLLCSLWEAYGTKEIWEMADGSYHNQLFSTHPKLLEGASLFRKKNCELTTKNAPPKSCYEVQNAKEHQFEAYKL